MEGFEFETESLYYGSIEAAICKHYDLGFANSSNFMEITEGRGQSITISAVKGSISCYVSAYKKKDENIYKVSVGCVNIKKNKR